MKPQAAAFLCATVISTACVLDIAIVVHRTSAASDTAKKTNQKQFSEAASAVSYDFNEGLGGVENAAFFLMATWIGLLSLWMVENFDNWETRRALAAWCVCIYGGVLAVMVILICSKGNNLNDCSDGYTVQGTGPFGDCSIQSALSEELNEIWYPRIIGGATTSLGLYLLSATGYTIAEHAPLSHNYSVGSKISHLLF